VSFYLDTSVLLSLFVEDAHSLRADAWFEAKPRDVIVSTWAGAEFAAVIRRLQRSGELTAGVARELLAAFDTWRREHAGGLDLSPAAGMLAENLARDAARKLSASDALHLALTVAAGAGLVTFDERLAAAAKAKKCKVEKI
jgi:uncharacterized protein